AVALVRRTARYRSLKSTGPQGISRPVGLSRAIRNLPCYTQPATEDCARIRPKMDASTMRRDGRKPDQLRPVKITRAFTRTSPGSVLINACGTTVLCTASIDPTVPPWMVGQGRGWLTAEYNMLPGSTSPRKKRERDGKTDGRTTEIQRLIGRSL